MREECESMRRAAVAGEVSAVLVYGADRLPRNGSELLAALEEFDGHGVPVHFVKDQHGIRARTVSRLRRATNVLVRFVLSLVGHGNANTARNRD